MNLILVLIIITMVVVSIFSVNYFFDIYNSNKIEEKEPITTTNKIEDIKNMCTNSENMFGESLVWFDENLICDRTDLSQCEMMGGTWFECKPFEYRCTGDTKCGGFAYCVSTCVFDFSMKSTYER